MPVTGLLLDGVELLVIGMGIVYAFLLLQVGVLTLAARLVRLREFTIFEGIDDRDLGAVALHLEEQEFAAEQPGTWKLLLERISKATIGFLNTLIAEGAAVYQLFDSWAGELTAEEYEEWAQPYHQEILHGATGVPRVLFVKEGPYLDRMCQTGAEVISLGVRHDLAAARRDYPHLVFQGNVDHDILRDGTPEQVTADVRRCLAQGGGQMHIVNLNHGVDKSTPVANFEAYIRAAKGG